MNYSGCQFDGIGIFTPSVHKRYQMPLNFSYIQPYIRFYRADVCGLVPMTSNMTLWVTSCLL